MKATEQTTQQIERAIKKTRFIEKQTKPIQQEYSIIPAKKIFFFFAKTENYSIFAEEKLHSAI